MKVFIVEVGAYSDRYVSAVFSSAEKAQAYIDLTGDGDFSEYELDGSVGYVELVRYEAEIDLRTGDIFRQRNHRWFGSPNLRSEEAEIFDYTSWPKLYWPELAGRIVGKAISYVSAEHAIKLAAECRQSYLRNHNP
jgi:hypothetical protein